MDILSLIPQRPPFVMIDDLLDSKEGLTRTTFRIKEQNLFVRGGRFTEPGLIENIAQTAAAGAGYAVVHEQRDQFDRSDHADRSDVGGSVVRNGFIGSIKNLEIHALPEVSDELITETTISGQASGVTLISGQIWCNGTLITRCEMTILLVDS